MKLLCSTHGRRDLVLLAMIAGWAMLLACVMVETASAQSISSPETSVGLSRGCVRIRQKTCHGNYCTVGGWSGTVVYGLNDGRLIILTCAHGFDGNRPAEVETQRTIWQPAQWINLVPQVDLGLLAVAPPPGGLPRVPIAEAMPTADMTFVTRGYPNSVEYREAPTSITEIGEFHWRTERRFIQGESGGALIGPAGLVGVIRSTELDDDNEPPEKAFRGRVVGLPTIQRFIQATFQPPQRRGQAQPPQERFQPFQQAPAQAGQPGAAAPPPQAMAPLPEAPQAKPAEKPPEKPADKPTEVVVEKPATVDWSLVQVVVLVPRQPWLDPWDSIVRWLQGATVDEDGPGQTVRRWINEETGAKADVRVVFERSQPLRYAATLAAGGVRSPGKYASLVALVKKQDASLLDPIKAVLVRFGQRAIDARLGDLPVEVVLDRTDPARVASIESALEVSDPSSAGSSPAWYVTFGMWIYTAGVTWWTGKPPRMPWNQSQPS